jgi:apolipoprotein N-acyltransferase
MTTVEVAAEPVVAPAGTGAARARPRWWVAVVLALAGGGAQLLAFPPYGLWWCAPVGVALLAAAVHRRGVRAGAGLGLLGGLALFVPLLSWTNIVGGTAPWLILAVLQAGFVALYGAGAAWCGALVDRYRWSWPLVTGALWTVQEALRDRYPFGGFPWGRLAFSQADSPLLRFAVLGGAPLVTFVVATTGGLLALAGWRRWVPRRTRLLDGAGVGGVVGGVVGGAVGGVVGGVALVGGAVLLVLAGLVVPTATPGGPPLTVAIVQGNVPRLGLEFNAQRRAVLDNHVSATLDLATRVRAGQAARPDLVVWPENASDIDPLVDQDADARARIQQAADAIGVPIVLGAVLLGPGEHARNATLVWLPATGMSHMYVKRHPVPFAEYMPLRSVARLVSDRVDLVRTDFVPGDRPGVVRAGPATLGVAICFEVAYDGLVRDTVTGGAQLLVVQTNNADFTPAEATQQLAMVRLRAVEHGRDGLMVSTVGISGFVRADGTSQDETGFNTPAVRLRQLRLGGERTLAAGLGPVPEYILVGLGVAALVGAALPHRRTRYAQTHTLTDTAPDQEAL